MELRHVVSARQFDKKTVEKILSLTDKIKSQKKIREPLSGKIMVTLFYEPSTRTRLSFESAMNRLGGKVISTESAKDFSSVAKGETLEDTIRIINGYCDLIVLRHDQAGASAIAAKHSKVPIINAGDGNGEHPTQALLDLYTIFSKFKTSKVTIAMVGDLINGRTIHSLSYLLSLFKGLKIIYVSPKALGIPKYLRDYIIERGVQFKETEDFEKSIKEADVIYQTRIQKERFSSEKEYKKYFGKYIINEKILKILKKDSIIMHPLPRINEITPNVDLDPRAYYFEEARNGLYVRMALISFLFDKASPKN